ncbi:MAG: single-stranded DNA-binding protein [Candidatus Omnitrophica bacterium]|nr:single-stranded DNA-binding protein [Candidatus Omnitrophota bacterium]
MANLNKVFLMGNLTRDPELRYVPSGAPVATFGLAVNRRYVTQSGEKKDEVCFVRIVVFGKQAESCSQYLSKGRPVFIEGRLQYRAWEQDGQKRSILDVIADRVQFLGGGQKSTHEGDASSGGAVKEESMDNDGASDPNQGEDAPF